MNLAMLLQAAQDVVVPAGYTKPLLGASEVFMLLFITLGPPLKTPAVYFARTHQFDAKTQRVLAFRTFVLATIAVLIGGFLGVALRGNWHISTPAMLLAGGIIFFLVSLRTVLEQYEPAAVPPAAPSAGNSAVAKPVPSAFEMAVPMIITPYGLAALIILLSASHSMERTIVVTACLLGVMVLHLLAMLFAGPMLRTIGPLPFKIFGTVIGSLTVGLSIQMMIAALVELGLLGTSTSLLG
jgi:multiple antibiotic resistance protein